LAYKYKPKYDRFKEPTKLLQEFFYARASSSEDIKRRFGIYPVEEGRVFFMKDGIYRYSNEDIITILKIFQKVINALCGCKGFHRLPM